MRVKDRFFYSLRRIFYPVLSLLVIAGFRLFSFQSCQKIELRFNDFLKLRKGETSPSVKNIKI